MTNTRRVCLKCGATVFADAPQGCCSVCLVRTGLASLDDENDEASEPAIARMLKDFGDYELLEEIGRGGQGVVYRARQKSLNRIVALKVIGLAHWATQAHVKRFRMEAEAAAHLDDPRIVPIYEIGERDGAFYFSMKFIEGEQLDKIIDSEPLPGRKAAELMAKLAHTLHHAHQNGVLHRDVKPGNILVDAKGEPHLTDFGLARLVETESTVTRTMEVLGTPSYMAPEQAAGNNTQLTSATDVYGLGAVLYQLLTGHPPFVGGTTYETVRMVLETQPRQPRLWNPKVDRDLETICLKCLEKEPAKRYASAEALAEDIERFLRNEPIRSRRASRVEHVWRWCKRKPLVASLAATLILVLAIGLTGALWELRRVQAEQALVRRANLSEQEKARLAAEQTKNPAAYDAYLRGRTFPGFWHQEGAIRLFQEAVRLDPNFVLAWAYLSIGQSTGYWMGTDPTPARLAAAKDALDRALTLDADLPETHLALGYYRYYAQRDYAGALAEFQQAEKGLPNSADVIEALAALHRRLGHWDEAVAEQRRSVELDPRNIHACWDLATTYRCLRRFPEALATVDRALAWVPANRDLGLISMKADLFLATGDLQAMEPLLANPRLDPTLRAVYALFQRRYAAAIEILSKALANETDRNARNIEKLLLGLSQQRAGDIAAARATYQDAAHDFDSQLKKVPPDSFSASRTHAFLGEAYAGLGEAASAIAEGQKAMAIEPISKDPVDGPVREETMADIYALLGDAEHAVPILKRLLQIPYNGAITPALLRLDPIWDQIRNDPRFRELADRRKETVSSKQRR
jgi:tetratricopeptide (TPR) repeat protein/predicted Ser/Thr protein kinase